MGIIARFTDGLANLASGLGTSADKRTGSFYHRCPITPDQIDAAYRTSWLVRKIVDVPALDMTRERRDWQAEQADIEKLEGEEKRLKLWAKVRQALILGRLGGGAIILGVGNEDPALPINARSLKAGALRYMHVVSRWRLSIGQIVMDPRSDLFGQPEYFSLGSQNGAVRIHPSRVVVFRGLHIPELGITMSEEQFWGDSVIQSINDAVKNADTATAGFASLIHEAKVDTVSIPGLIGHVATPEGEALIKKRVEIANLFKSVWNTRILDGGTGEDGTAEEWDTRQINWAGMPDVMNAFMGFVAGAADIPATRLLGRSPQGMNATGDGDLTNYYDRIQAQQDSDLRPQLEQIDQVLIPSAGVTMGEQTKTWFEFPPLTTPTEAEEATTFNTSMDAITKLQSTGAVPDLAMSKAVQNFMVERGYLPGLEGALAEIPEAERFPEPSDDEVDPSALTQEGGDQSARGEKIAANDAAPRTLYVSRKLLNASEFIAWAKGQGFETTTPADDLHVTIAFSRTPVDWMKMGDNWSDNGKGGLTVPAGGARIVEPLGDKGAVVLLFASSSLSWRHEEMIRNGASHDFSEYQPHVTITYQKPDGLDLKKVEPFRGKLEFGPEIFAEVVDDWEKSLKEG